MVEFTVLIYKICHWPIGSLLRKWTDTVCLWSGSAALKQHREGVKKLHLPSINAEAKCQMQKRWERWWIFSSVYAVLESLGRWWWKKSIICPGAIQSAIRSRGCINKLCPLLMQCKWWGEMKCCRFLWAVEELVSLRPPPSREGEWCVTEVCAGAQRNQALACLQNEGGIHESCLSISQRWTDSLTCSPMGPGRPGNPLGPSSPFWPNMPCCPLGPASPSEPCWVIRVGYVSFFWLHLSKPKQCTWM